MCKVSIIVPIYNTEAYLPKTLDSLCAQTFNECEFILIDDGSRDGSLLICNKYARLDNRFVVVSQKNRGVSFARNKGIDIAKGDYIGFVDSDDLVLPDYVQKLYENACDSDIVMCSAVRRIIGEDDKILNLGFDYNCFITGQEMWQTFGHTYLLSSANWNKLYKRELIGDKRFKKAKNGEDLLFNYEVINYDACISVIVDPLYIYNQRSGSASQIADFESLYYDGIVRLKVIEKMGESNISGDFISSAVFPLLTRYIVLKGIGRAKKTELALFRNKILRLRNTIRFNLKTKLIFVVFSFGLYGVYLKIKKANT